MAEKQYPGTRKKGATWGYRFKVTLPNGKKKEFEKSGFKSSYEAYKAREMAVSLYKITHFIDKKITLNQMYDLWKENYSNGRSYTTLLKYDSMYDNHIREELGLCYVSKIQALDINEFLNDMVENYDSEYPVSFYQLFTVLFEFATKHKYVSENIMQFVDRPRVAEREEVKLLSPEEFNALEERLRSTNVQIAYAIAKNTGLRSSEIYAIRWGDISFEDNTLKVDRQLQRRKGVWCFTRPKTRAGIRTVKFGNAFAEYLKWVKEVQKEDKARLKDFYKKNNILNCIGKNEELIEVEDFVVVKDNGEMLSPYSNRVITRIAKDMGLKFNFHMLRHYYITSLIENGVDLPVIRDNVGHSSLRTIMSVYAHTTPVQRERAGEVIDTIMGAKNLIPKADIVS